MRLAAVVVPALVVAAIVAVLLAPHLIHGLDHGAQSLSVEELAGGAPRSTRNLSVGGRAAMDHYLTEDQRRTEGSSSVSTGTSLYVPIVPEGWTPAEPVHVVLKTHYYGLRELGERRVQAGLLRDVWWEGLDGGVRRYFTDQMGLKLAPDVLLLDEESRGVPLTLCWLAIFGAFGIVLLLSLRTNRSRAR